jgi:putative transcriptional regulator
MSKTTTIARVRRNGKLVQVKADNTEEDLDTPPLASMTAAEIEAGAARYHENPPLNNSRLRQLRPVPRVKTLRRALALTQEEFAAARYHIPLGTMRIGNRAARSRTTGKSLPRGHRARSRRRRVGIKCLAHFVTVILTP